jgi:hypothetical protein
MGDTFAGVALVIALLSKLSSAIRHSPLNFSPAPFSALHDKHRAFGAVPHSAPICAVRDSLSRILISAWPGALNSSAAPFASFTSAVSKPSVN